MSSFIATAEPAASGSPGGTTVLTNDGWFPDIDLNDLRASMRLDGTVTHERLRSAVLDAMASVNAELAVWRVSQRAAGYSELARVPAPTIGGHSTLNLRYQRAVYHLAYADLTEQYRGYDSTKTGGQKADDLTNTVDEARRNARWAVSDIRGIPRSTIELI